MKEELIGGLIGFAAHFLGKTLKFKTAIHPDTHFDHTSIYCFWHNRVMMAPEVWQRITATGQLCCLTSASRDGTITSAMMRAYGISSVRGSSSRRGKRAMIDMMRILRSGTSLAITPDGPRGPKYQMNPGLIKLAATTQTPIVPATFNYSSYWELKTWDQFRIPKPFSTVEVTMGQPITVDKDANEIVILDIKYKLQEIMGQN